jgi:adenylate cyclase
MEFLKKLLRSFIIGTVVGIIIAFITNNFVTDLIDRLEHQSYYMRYFWKYMELPGKKKEKTSEEQDNGIYIVNIDDRSLHKLGLYWNWNRSYHAQMISSLNKHFPAAIAFDINFYDPEDQNNRSRINDLLKRSQVLHPLLPLTDQVCNSILSTIDYDKQFIEATKTAGIVYNGIRLSSEKDYSSVGLSQIMHRATRGWQDSLNPQSCITVNDDAFKYVNHEKNIVDGIFPELAQVSRGIGHLNMAANDDGVIREVDLFYSFGKNREIYLPLSIRVVATLFGTPNNEIIFKPSKYIDIGTPFKILKDSSGAITFSYPTVTISQVRLILNKAQKILSLKSGQHVSISTLLSIAKDSAGNRTISSYFGDLAPEVVAALESFDRKSFLNMNVTETKTISTSITLSRESDQEWILKAPFGDQEWYLTADNLEMICQLRFNEFSTVRPGEKKLIFHNLSVQNNNGKLQSSLPVLREKTLEDLCGIRWDDLERMKPGTRMDFGTRVKIPLTSRNQHIITYIGKREQPFKYWSYYDIMNDRIQGSLDGKIYLVGSTVPALFDIVNVSVSNEYPGVEVHASLINSFITNTFIHRLEPWQDFFILILVGIMVGIIAYLFKPLTSSLCTFVFIFLYFLVGMTLFGTDNLWIEIVRPILTIFLTYAAVMAYRYISEEKDRKFLQNTFKQYLSPELIDTMYKSRQMPELGGDEGIRTAYFTDIQGFSTFSEKLGSPTRLVELLNEYLTAMTDILLSRFGTLDKYEGDAIIAFFGAPMPMKDHAHQACFTALDMQNKLAELRKKWTHEGDKWPQIVHTMRMRIGINTGAIMTGNMGSKTRMNYTMMGDAVNLAARLEGAAKQYGIYTMISHYTHDIIKNDFETRMLDKITVVGKSEPITVYELLSKKGSLDPKLKKCVELYTKGLDYFYAQQWDQSIEVMIESEKMEPNYILSSKSMTPSRKVIENCEMYKTTPPGKSWDGVFKLTSK